MKMFFLTLVYLFVAILIPTCEAQNNFKNGIGLNIGSVRNFPETGNQSYRFTIPNGIMLLHKFDALSVRTNFNYFQFTEELNTSNCSDCPEGSGEYKGFEAKVGAAKEFFSLQGLSFFVATDIYFTRSSFKGMYRPGFALDPSPVYKDEKTNRFGVSPSIGFSYSPIDELTFWSETGYHLGRSSMSDNVTFQKTAEKEVMFVPLTNIAISYNL